VARYYLTGTIYLVNEKGVYRYQNRNPVKDMRTADHRIEPINAGDVRDKLRSAVSGLPQAPCYIVLCLPKINSLISQDRDFALLETGFVAGNVLVQASAMGLGCNFETALSPDEQAGMRGITGIPASDTPQAIISLGGAAK
jgi:nitroreductase